MTGVTNLKAATRCTLLIRYYEYWVESSMQHNGNSNNNKNIGCCFARQAFEPNSWMLSIATFINWILLHFHWMLYYCLFHHINLCRTQVLSISICHAYQHAVLINTPTEKNDHYYYDADVFFFWNSQIKSWVVNLAEKRVLRHVNITLSCFQWDMCEI